MLFHTNSGYANALQCHIYAFVACFIFIAIKMIGEGGVTVIFLHAFESRGKVPVLNLDTMQKYERFSTSVLDAVEW